MSQSALHRRRPQTAPVQQPGGQADVDERDSIEALIAQFLQLVRELEDRRK